jgi:hypothetical protein
VTRQQAPSDISARSFPTDPPPTRTRYYLNGVAFTFEATETGKQ